MVPQPPFSQWAAMSFLRGGSEVIWKDLLCTHCAHCLCKPVISGGIKLRHTTDENFRDFTVAGGGCILNRASVCINQIKFAEKRIDFTVGTLCKLGIPLRTPTTGSFCTWSTLGFAWRINCVIPHLYHCVFFFTFVCLSSIGTAYKSNKIKICSHISSLNQFNSLWNHSRTLKKPLGSFFFSPEKFLSII